MDQETITSGRRPGGGVTDDAIERIRERIASGTWGPGTRLPREADLAKQLGLSRNSLREAVRALSLARVLEVRRGDGTYVSSLEADELLEPTLSATHLLRGRRSSSCSRCGACSSPRRRRWPRSASTTT
jgi:DNA-binding FadR family transcriptional regulator